MEPNTEIIFIEPWEMKKFIIHPMYGNGRVRIWDDSTDSEAILDFGKYFLRVNGREVPTTKLSEQKIMHQVEGLINKYGRFEYGGNCTKGKIICGRWNNFNNSLLL